MGFAEKLIRWQRRHGRHGLPWQGSRDPYRIWLSEVMLQQTQVAVVVRYYERFLKKYPTAEALAAASVDEVLELWSGLGYYARGRNLHAAAVRIAKAGFPRTAAALAELPGVGRSTAGAIAAFAFGERAPMLDGNARRVLARCFALEDEAQLWRRAERELPVRGIGRYTQALMDLGALVCTRARPRCEACPVADDCVARGADRVAELPLRRPRKPLPQKEVTWLVLRHGTQVLLEKRPAAGLWGGLWCFPEAGPSERGTRLAPIEHTFTHFRLRIHPLLRELRAKPMPLEARGRRWLAIAQAGDAAVPTPVRTLLGRL